MSDVESVTHTVTQGSQLTNHQMCSRDRRIVDLDICVHFCEGLEDQGDSVFLIHSQQIVFLDLSMYLGHLHKINC